ncbi:hypothetical protein EYF80_011383 [Liparis tanakae]|uniref:Uncharacterized protein n=1 Tax=Liparis tanakae TaxID=230148 RepID=A0A4Z2IK96_9TELE|nr:hypothetical protein EYF80_011383 [Liparis tanakae]
MFPSLLLSIGLLLRSATFCFSLDRTFRLGSEAKESGADMFDAGHMLLSPIPLLLLLLLALLLLQTTFLLCKLLLLLHGLEIMLELRERKCRPQLSMQRVH